MATDPVCGMDVDEDDPAAVHEYQGDTYYFCAPGCKNKFEQDPEEYLPVEEDNGSGHAGEDY